MICHFQTGNHRKIRFLRPDRSQIHGFSPDPPGMHTPEIVCLIGAAAVFRHIDQTTRAFQQIRADHTGFRRGISDHQPFQGHASGEGMISNSGNILLNYQFTDLGIPGKDLRIKSDDRFAFISNRHNQTFLMRSRFCQSHDPDEIPSNLILKTPDVAVISADSSHIRKFRHIRHWDLHRCRIPQCLLQFGCHSGSIDHCSGTVQVKVGIIKPTGIQNRTAGTAQKRTVQNLLQMDEISIHPVPSRLCHRQSIHGTEPIEKTRAPFPAGVCKFIDPVYKFPAGQGCVEIDHHIGIKATGHNILAPNGIRNITIGIKRIPAVNTLGCRRGAAVEIPELVRRKIRQLSCHSPQVRAGQVRQQIKPSICGLPHTLGAEKHR